MDLGSPTAVTVLNGDTGFDGYDPDPNVVFRVIGFTRSLAREVIGDGISVNCIAPGAIATGILPSTPDEDAEILQGIPAGRFGRPDEIAPTAVMLASRDGDFYVGQVLSPNGGEVML